MEKEPEFNKKKNRNIYFCVAYSRCFYTYIHRVIKKIGNTSTTRNPNIYRVRTPRESFVVK